MNAIENDIRALVDKELAAANERFPQFHSQHEGYAVILEEVEECEEVFAFLKEELSSVKNAVWHDKEANVTFLFGDAMKLAIEAIQVAAMCKKFLEARNGN